MRLRPLVLSCVLGVGLSLCASSALAQQDGEFSVQRFEPAPGPDNFITVEGARVRGNMAWSVGLFANYAHKPFVVRSCESETNCDDPNALLNDDIAVVKDLMTADLLASLTPIPKLQIGLRIPVSYVNGDGIDAESGQPADGGLSGAGLGDPTLEGKYRFFGEPDTPLVLAGGAFVSGPVGHAMAEDKYIGYSSPVFGLRGIADFQAGPLSAGANLAGLYRSSATLGSTELGPEFRYGVAAGYAVSPVFKVMGEGYGATKFSNKNGTNSLEGLLAVRIQPLQSRFAFTVGGGSGIIQGVGVPMFRGFVGVLYSHAPTDQDADGIPDDRDECPTDPEDLEGFEDEDGCPDPDNDADTIPDELDKCPLKAESRQRFRRHRWLS